MVQFIVTTYFDESTDRKAYQDYIRIVKPIVQKYHGRYIVRSEKVTPLGTDWNPSRVIIIAFDTREHLDACFASEEYKKIAFLRENSVDSRAVIVE